MAKNANALDMAELYDAVLHKDLVSFVEKVFCELNPGQIYKPSWYIQAIAEQARLIMEGKSQQTIICLPPRHLKSIILSVALPAFQLGHNPSTRIMCISYGQDLAAKHAKACALVMRSSWYRKVFPNTILATDTELELVTTMNGSRRAVSTGGAITGLGANLIIIDDPMKADDVFSPVRRGDTLEWFSNTLATRLDNKAEDKVIVTMQRLHQEDLAGHLLDQGGWNYLAIPAEAQITTKYRTGPQHYHIFKQGQVLSPKREPKAVLEKIRRQMGPSHYSAQYLQEPLPDGQCLFQWQWFQSYDPKETPKFDYIFQSWDVASSLDPKACFSVCTTWGVVGKRYYLWNVDRQRLIPTDLVTRAMHNYEKYEANIVLVEATGAGVNLFDFLRKKLGHRALNHKPAQDKVTRAEKQVLKISDGQVFIPASAPWLEDFRREIVSFPQGKYDDQVDSMVGFLMCVTSLIARVHNLGLHHHKAGDDPIPAPSCYTQHYTNYPRLVSYS